jgi:HEAT repeat protein
LGNLGDARAVEALRNVLGDRESRLRKDASEALAKLGETKWTQWLWGDAGDWGRLAKSADESVVEILISNLGSKEPATLEVVAQHLGDLGNKRAVEPLIDLLGHITGTVRKSAADALRKLGEPNWQQMVKGDGDDFSRLGMSGDPRAVRCLTAALQHPRLWTRRQAASALIKMAESNPKLIAGIWRDVAEAVNAPHTDKNVGTLAGGENHVDDGIGLKFPDEPPATDF